MSDEGQGSGQSDDPSLLQYFWNTLMKFVSTDNDQTESETHDSIWDDYVDNVLCEHPCDVGAYYSTRFQPKSKIGNTGTPMSLITNYIQMQLSHPVLYTYRVEFPREYRKLMRQLIQEHQSLFNVYFFDGERIISTKLLDIPNGSPLELSSSDGRRLIKIHTAREIDNHESLKVLNLVLSRAMNALELKPFGQSYYDASTPVDIPNHSTQMLPGYKTTIQQHEKNVLLCADVCSIPMRTENMRRILGQIGVHNENACRREIVGEHVFARGYEWVFVIRYIIFDPASSVDCMNIVDYYRKKFGLIVKDLHGPLFIADYIGGCCCNADMKETIVIVPEFCYAIGLTNMMRMDRRLMENIGWRTRIWPPGYVQKLTQFFQSLINTPECAAILGEWNIQLDPQLVEVTGRVLNRPTIKFGDREIHANKMGCWTNESLDMKILQPPGTKLTNWYVISTNSDLDDTQSFLACLQKVAWEMGFDMGCPAPIRTIPDGHLINVTTAFLDELDVCALLNPQFILCVAEYHSDAIMKKIIVDLAIPTQCISPRAFREQGVTMVRNVATQILCKLGGAPWSIQMPMSKVMIIGCDVYPSRNNECMMPPSNKFGAIVATMDLQRRSQFFSAVSYGNAADLSEGLANNVIEALQEFKRIEGQLPDRILLYRNGVEQDDAEYVHNSESKCISTKLKKVYCDDFADKPVRFAYIIVSKPITRFFTKKNGVYNPPPGTVVDDVITFPKRYDFYLISHYVGQGCVSPTAYNVFNHGFGLPPSHLQWLTYMLCHLYYDTTRASSVPAVCQYAHKLASLIADHIHEKPSQLWEQSLSLYYL